MYCKDCVFREELGFRHGLFVCTNENLTDEANFNKSGDKLLYSYYEGGEFYVEDYFGCVHFRSAEEKKD